MPVEQGDNGDEEADGESVVCGCFVRLIEGVGLGEFCLMVCEPLLLDGIEYEKLSLIAHSALQIGFGGCFGRQVI